MGARLLSRLGLASSSHTGSLATEWMVDPQMPLLLSVLSAFAVLFIFHSCPESNVFNLEQTPQSSLNNFGDCWPSARLAFHVK